MPRVVFALPAKATCSSGLLTQAAPIDMDEDDSDDQEEGDVHGNTEATGFHDSDGFDSTRSEEQE